LSQEILIFEKVEETTILYLVAYQKNKEPAGEKFTNQAIVPIC
jgi:hypothetical protein